MKANEVAIWRLRVRDLAARLSSATVLVPSRLTLFLIFFHSYAYNSDWNILPELLGISMVYDI